MNPVRSRAQSIGYCKRSFGNAVRKLIGRAATVEMVSALRPSPLRRLTLDAIHLATLHAKSGYTQISIQRFGI